MKESVQPNSKSPVKSNSSADNFSGSKEEHSEGSLTQKIEDQTAKIPSGAFLAASILSIGASALLKVSGRDKDAQFVGQWVAPFLLLGVYNKIVKTLGND